MAYNVTITYTPTNDIFNAKKEVGGVVTAAPIPGLGGRSAPSDAYIYAPDSATKPVYNKECVCTIKEADGTVADTDKYKDVGYITSGQRRWPKAATQSIMGILEAYATPQVPVYRAWQSFKMAIDGSTPYAFKVETFAESEFYREAGLALAKYGITVATSEAA